MININEFSHQLKWKNEILDQYYMNMKGEIFSNRSNKILSPFLNKERRYMVSVIYREKKKLFRVDYLVAYTFLGCYDDSFRLIHINGNENDYSLGNLRWLRISDILKKYEKEYSVNSVTEIDEVWKLYGSLIAKKRVDVSNFGNIRDHDTHEIISPRLSHGYFCFFEKNKVHHVHRMVGELFLKNPEPKKFNMINHLDGNKKNNAFYNLEWCNCSMNTDHAHMMGYMKKYDESTIRKICEQLVEGIPQIVISEKMNIPAKYISKLATGVVHKDITKDYHFKKEIPLGEKYNRPLLEILIHEKKTPKEISKLLNIDYNTSFIKYYERIKRIMANRKTV